MESPRDRTFLDRLLYPLNLVASARWLREARRTVWRNAELLKLGVRGFGVALPPEQWAKGAGPPLGN